MKGFYILGGYPDMKKFEEVFKYLAEKADFVEVGLAYNDPVADGPVIAEAASKVVKSNIKIDDILKIVEAYKKSKVYIMTYANIFYQYGLMEFSQKYGKLINGVIVADLPNRMHGFFYDNGFDIPIIPFVTPESREEDIEGLKGTKADFIYFVGVRGVTGSNVNFLDDELVEKVKFVKKMTSKKVVFGFGIKTKNDTEKVMTYADGFVIGTEAVKRQTDTTQFKRFINSIIE
ncbi:tryptophan synthase subunit alpha [Deferribacteraceae bacterium V6Fe1]|nr:tryptophan synthase subunit alpha [Deferribacteraceae bacterium V6Fe1]